MVKNFILCYIFQLFALVGIAVSIWMFMDSTIPLHFTQKSNDYLISTVIILLASIVLFFASILGLYSVNREVRKALVVVSHKIWFSLIQIWFPVIIDRESASKC